MRPNPGKSFPIDVLFVAVPETAAIKFANIPEHSLKRRFKAAAGIPLIDYLQNVRIEHAKRSSICLIRSCQG
jgi:hypothetical protein